MRETTVGLLGVALVGLLLVAALPLGTAPAAGSATAVGNHATNESDTSETQEYTLAELREPGRQLSNSPPSVRIAEDPGLLIWLKHVPAGALASGDSRQASKFVARSTVVKRNTVFLRTNLVSVPAGAEALTVRSVAYRVGTDRNGTETLQNVTVSESQVQLSPGFSRSAISLPQVDGEPKHVTMWLIYDGERVATWQFEHRSAATTADAPIGAGASIGDLMRWGFINVGIPILFGGVGGVVLGLRAIKRARAGPGATGITWLIVGSVPAGVVLAVVYFNLVELVVSNPALLALPAAFPLALLTVLYAPGSGVEKGVLVRPSITEVESPSGDEGADYERAREEVIRLVDTPDGGKAVVKDGWISFFSRIYGGLAVVDNWEEAKALTKLPDSTHDWLHILSPSSTEGPGGEDLYGYERPGLTLSLPESRLRLATRAVTVLGMSAVGWAIYPGRSVALGAVVGLATGVVLSLDGTSGWAIIPWGSKHHRRAYATASKLATEMDAADSVHKSERARMQEKATTHRQSREMAADMETAFYGEMFGTSADLGDQLVDANSGDGDAAEAVVAAVKEGDLDTEQALALLDDGEEPAVTDGGAADG